MVIIVVGGQWGDEGGDRAREDREVGREGWHEEGWELGEKNGSEGTWHGAARQRLDPDETASIEAGTVVTLDEVASFTDEVVQ